MTEENQEQQVTNNEPPTEEGQTSAGESASGAGELEQDQTGTENSTGEQNAEAATEQESDSTTNQ